MTIKPCFFFKVTWITWWNPPQHTFLLREADLRSPSIPVILYPCLPCWLTTPDLTWPILTSLFTPTATLEPTYRQLQTMRLDKSPFVIISVIGQELLAAGHYAAAVVVLESALKIGTCSLKLRGSVFSALSSAYWALNSLDKVSWCFLVYRVLVGSL